MTNTNKDIDPEGFTTSFNREELHKACKELAKLSEKITVNRGGEQYYIGIAKPNLLDKITIWWHNLWNK